VVEAGGQRGPHVARARRLLVEVGEEDGELALALERHPPGQRLVEHAGQRVDVGAAIDLLALDLLRRDVGDRAHEGLLSGQAARARGVLGQPEVRQVRVVVAADQDVGRLDVAVDQPVGMGLVERRADLGHQVDRALGIERAFVVQQPAQVGAVDVAHRQEDHAVGLAEVEDLDDMGMPQSGRDLRLAQEAPPHAVVARQAVGQDLERDAPAVADPLGPVHRTARAFADELDDAIARQDRADGQLPAHAPSLPDPDVAPGNSPARAERLNRSADPQAGPNGHIARQDTRRLIQRR
jgi:hypothetical protein